jgi:hypothetical protein
MNEDTRELEQNEYMKCFIEFIEKAHDDLSKITAKEIIYQLKVINSYKRLDFFSESSLLWVIEWIKMRENIKDPSAIEVEDGFHEASKRFTW